VFSGALHGELISPWHIAKETVLRVTLGRCSRRGDSSSSRGNQSGGVGFNLNAKVEHAIFKALGIVRKSVNCSSAAPLNKQTQ
jgi:hypothetical protein